MNSITPEGNQYVIGNNIAKLLEARKENISEFSRHADISYPAAFDLAKGQTKMITFDMLNKLCNYFGVGPSELFPYTPDRKKREED